MKHQILFLGKTREKYIEDGIADFSSRLKNYTNVTVSVLKDAVGGKNTSQLKDKQGQLLIKTVAKGAFIVALDAGGRQFTSETFAELIGHWEMRGTKQISYLIGGPDGLSREVLDNAGLKLSLSRMTFTHDMVRLLLIEQLYRAYTIKAGEKYHK